MNVSKPFQFLHSFSAALAAGILLVYAAGVSAAPVPPPPPTNGGAKVIIQAGEPLDKKAGYAKKVKPSKVKKSEGQGKPNNPGAKP